RIGLRGPARIVEPARLPLWSRLIDVLVLVILLQLLPDFFLLPLHFPLLPLHLLAHLAFHLLQLFLYALILPQLPVIPVRLLAHLELIERRGVQLMNLDIAHDG